MGGSLFLFVILLRGPKLADLLSILHKRCSTNGRACSLGNEMEIFNLDRFIIIDLHSDVGGSFKVAVLKLCSLWLARIIE
ncbi:MAG: hypothetical protein CMK36_09470 [Porticoccaceae bacterium]|nr:hypothetical protein [Porticoccaceae bacterium]